MKNLMSRNEYLQKANEGFISDKIKSGWEKFKSMFKIGMKKVKNFMAIFDNNGNVLPVISPFAIIDKFSKSNSVKVYAPKLMSDLTIQAGGNGCDEKAQLIVSNEDYEDAPEGSREYKNFLTLSKYLNGKVSESNHSVFESWKDIEDNRNKYLDDDEGFSKNLKKINYNQFKTEIRKLVREWSENEGRPIEYGTKGQTIKPKDNILVFGCPGIGKSTIPNAFIEEYNRDVAKMKPDKMITIVSVNCSTLTSGDVAMPTAPQKIDIIKAIQNNPDAFPKSNEILASMSEDENKKLKEIIDNSAQYQVNDVPKAWLPSYKKVGGILDKIQNEKANGGIFEDKKTGETYQVGNGGIILLDELLRADEDVFRELMNFLFEREFNGWKLGSKWAIIACSNRPCESIEVAKVWQHWENEPAQSSRFCHKYLLEPDPESWKDYVLKDWDEMVLGKLDIIMNFIFDPTSKKGDEYPRWISTVKLDQKDENDKSASLHPVLPRDWYKAIEELKKHMLDNDINNILKMNSEEFDDVFGSCLNKDLLFEFKEYFEQHKEQFDIDMIMDDPHNSRLEKEVVNDTVRANTIIENIVTTLKERYDGENISQLKDDKLANIIAWIGINFKNDMEIAMKFYRDISGKNGLLTDKTPTCLPNFQKSMMTFLAAYPLKGLEDEEVKRYQTIKDPVIKQWPEDSMEIIKGIMKKYFPWRMKGDKILYYDDMVVPEIKKDEE